MGKLLGAFPDITIAVVLIIIGLVVVLAAQMHVLPKKSLPFIVAGLAGVFGIALFRRWREQSLRGDLKRLENHLDGLSQRAQGTAQRVSAAEQQRTAALAEVERQRAALQKQLLLTRAQTAQEKDRISTLQGEDLFLEFDQTFGKP